MAVDKHEEVRRRAYEIWEQEGRPEGAAHKHWLQAFDEIIGDDNEHETMQDLIDEDDYDDSVLLEGHKPKGPPKEAVQISPEQTHLPDVEITTGRILATRKVKSVRQRMI